MGKFHRLMECYSKQIVYQQKIVICSLNSYPQKGKTLKQKQGCPASYSSSGHKLISQVIIFGAHSVGTCDSSAFITKLLTASTLHAHAAHTLLHPKSASGTLFKSGSPCKGHEGLVFRIHPHILTVVLTRHICVEFASALQAVPLIALLAGEVGVLGVELKQEIAIWSGTPGGAISIAFHILIYHEILSLHLKLGRHEIQQLLLGQLDPAILAGTPDVDLPTLN